MKRIYHPYWLWEDYKAGMYDLSKEYTEQEEMELANKVKQLLGNKDKFLEVGKKVIKEWKYSCDVNLSNTSRNRQAFIGQATCCYEHKIPERITKLGWRLLLPSEQKEANEIADKLFELWKRGKNAQKILV